ncbi:GNAT family N-acetyltransferase, partial [Flavobacteriales bacterium]|nr:GNAT family N-acetyltransferase [Flavobacteriales bacterium]
MVRLWRNQEYVRNNMQFKELLTRINQQEWFNSMNQEANLFWVISFNEYPIGLIHIKDVDMDNLTGEAGVFVGEPSYLEMPQPMLAILFMMELAFYALGLKELKAKIKSGNQRAISFNQKLGYVLIPEQPDGFQYYAATDTSFQSVTKRIRSQSAHMYSCETIVEEVSKL